MPNLFFESQGVNTYLVYQIGEIDDIDTLSLGMLTNNTIPGLAAASFTQMDTTKYIKYNVSARVPVAQLFSGPVNKKRLLDVFYGVVDALLAAEDYMLDVDTLLLDLNYIFADVSTCETVVVCLPVMNSERKNPDLGMFFKNIIFNAQFDQTENCDHVAPILNYLNRTPVFMLSDFKAVLDGISKDGEPPKKEPVKASSGAPVSMTPPQTVVVAPPPEVKPASQPRVPEPKELKFGVNYSPVDKPGKTPVQPPVSQAPEVEEEEPISMLYLLQHYNKENAAKYKAQQEAKKAKKAGGSAAPAPNRPKKKTAAKKPSAGFAIPGQQEPANAGFAVPGQPEVPVPQTPSRPAKIDPKPIVQTPPEAPHTPPQPVRPINFGATTVLIGGDPGVTTLLGVEMGAPAAAPYLIREKNGERIPVNKPVFRVGKERSYVDYFVGDNTAVSRSHANIITKDSSYFIMDTNSSNHTFVNGTMIPSMVEVAIASGDKIRLANEDFTFQVM